MKFFTKKIILIYCGAFLLSCSSLYFGIKDLPDFDPELQSDKLGQIVKPYEDGLRTNNKNGEYEWWYFDANLDDGSVIVAYFWKIKNLKNFYYIGVNYNKPNGEEYKKIKFFNSKNVFISKDSCFVEFGNNVFKGNLKEYKIRIDKNDFDGFGFDLNLVSKTQSYRPQDGIISAQDDYFAWLAAVPNGKVEGNLEFKNQTKKINGDGYHDHNWGNVPLQKLFDDWIWFRGKAGPYTVIGFELNTISKRGGYSIPGIYIGDSTGTVYENFGQNGIFTSKENLISNLYDKNNETLFSKLKILTKDNFYLEIEGQDVIENLSLFDVVKIPFFKQIMQFSKVDPYYTRFKSKVKLKLSDGTEIDGNGVLEIMDLK